MSFYLSVLSSLKSECHSQDHFKLVEKEYLRALTQQIQPCSDLSQENQILQDILSLTEQIGVQLEPQLILQKLSLQKQEKDEIYKQRAKKLQRIQAEIAEYDKMILRQQNCQDNILKPQLQAIQQTYTQ